MPRDRRTFTGKMLSLFAITALTGHLDFLAHSAAGVISRFDALAQATTAALPANMELGIHFGLQASTKGIYHKPYVAVWVENSAGDVVKTISLWREQEDNKKKYLSNLRKWFRSARTPDMVSSPTRGAGQYSVVWDGLDSKGQRVPQGEYTLFIEAARETGPYQRVRMPLTLGSKPQKATAQDNGDLVNVSAEYRVH